MSSHVPLSKLDEGIQRAIDNAARYLNDAVFLYDNERYQSSILLSMLSYEESGKALLLMDYKSKKKEITRSQWVKKFCSHKMKNLISLRAIWQDAGYVSPMIDSDVSISKFAVDWKNVFTYADYDFENQKWTSPTIRTRDSENFSYNAMSRAADALKCIIARVPKFEKEEKSVSESS